MTTLLWFGIILSVVCWCPCQSSTLDINVVEISSTGNFTFVCNVASEANLTRWTYLSGSNGTSLMSFQDELCTVAPLGSFLSNSTKYSYTCQRTVYQVTLHLIYGGDVNNDILECRDAIQPDGSGSTWKIKIIQDGEQCNCNQTITFNIIEVTEGDNVLFVCRVSSNVTYVNWNVNFGSHTAPMGVQNGTCSTSPGTTFLDNTSEYIYTCNNTVYQVTKLNVQRSQHNDIYMCTPQSLQEGEGSNWVIKVRAPVTSVTISPANSHVNVTEHTTVEFKCTTSTSRPAASVYWYMHPNGNSNTRTQITENITTTTNYNDLSVINSLLRFVLTRLHNNMKIVCTANNSINTNPVTSNEILLDVQHKAYHPYITQGNEYHVIENTIGTLSCSAKGGNPLPKLSWKCENFSPTNISKNNSHGNVTTTLTWTASGNHEGICTCISDQTGYQNESIDVSLIVLYKPNPPTGFRYIESRTTTSLIHLEWKPGSENRPPQTFYIKYKKNSDTIWNYLKVPDNGEESMEFSLTELTANTEYEIVIFASNEKGNSSESSVLITTTKAIDKPNLGPLIGGIAGGVTGCIVLVIVIIVLIRRYPVFKRNGTDKQGMRRSISVDGNVPSAVTMQPNKPNVDGTEDVLYTDVKKTQKQVDVYENVAPVIDPGKKGATRQPHSENPTTKQPKIVNKEGLIYADLEFNDKPTGEKMVVKGDDPTTYALVDFPTKADPLSKRDK